MQLYHCDDVINEASFISSDVMVFMSNAYTQDNTQFACSPGFLYFVTGESDHKTIHASLFPIQKTIYQRGTTSPYLMRQ